MTLAVTLMNFITCRDHKVMLRVNQWRAPSWVRLWATWATRAGDGWLWYAVGVLVLLLGGRQRFLAVGSAALSAVCGVVIFWNVKRAAGRRRPLCFEPHCWANLIPPDQFSFPSGHTITAFAVAVSVSRFYPDAAGGLLFCALSIAASRILLGMHFLSDVLAGAAIGTCLACAWLL